MGEQQAGLEGGTRAGSRGASVAGGDVQGMSAVAALAGVALLRAVAQRAIGIRGTQGRVDLHGA